MSKALYIQCERKLSMKLKRKISRILSMTLAIMLLVPAMCADAFNFTPTSGYDDEGKAIPLELYSEAVYMVNLDSGEAIVDINGERRACACFPNKDNDCCGASGQIQR